MEKNKKIEELKARYKKIKKQLSVEGITQDEHDLLWRKLDKVMDELFEELKKNI